MATTSELMTGPVTLLVGNLIGGFYLYHRSFRVVAQLLGIEQQLTLKFSWFFQFRRLWATFVTGRKKSKIFFPKWKGLEPNLANLCDKYIVLVHHCPKVSREFINPAERRNFCKNTVSETPCWKNTHFHRF